MWPDDIFCNQDYVVQIFLNLNRMPFSVVIIFYVANMIC